MGRGGHKADAPGIHQGANLAAAEQGAAAAEDEIHRPGNQAVGEALLQQPVLTQKVRQEAVVPGNQIRGQGAQEQGILGGLQAAALHAEAVAVHRQRHLLTLFLRRPGIVDDGQIRHGHIVGAYGHGVGPEGVVLPAHLVQLLCIITIFQDGFFSTLPNKF